jgi:hypothetical protein
MDRYASRRSQAVPAATGQQIVRLLLSIASAAARRRAPISEVKVNFLKTSARDSFAMLSADMPARPSASGLLDGAEMRKGGALLSAALRYTRWAKDGSPNSRAPDYPRTNVNGVELIFGVYF